MKLFEDYVQCDRDTAKVEARFEARLEETQRRQVRYGFRNDVWLKKHHGDRKAAKIMQRKTQLGLRLILITPVVHPKVQNNLQYLFLLIVCI